MGRPFRQRDLHIERIGLDVIRSLNNMGVLMEFWKGDLGRGPHAPRLAASEDWRGEAPSDDSITRVVALRPLETEPSGVRHLRPQPDSIFKTQWGVAREVRMVGLSFYMSDAILAFHCGARHGEVTLTLSCEPQNPHDANAIALFCEGRRIAYAPAAEARVWAPVMDARAGLSFALSDFSLARDESWAALVLTLLRA